MWGNSKRLRVIFGVVRIVGLLWGMVGLGGWEYEEND